MKNKLLILTYIVVFVSIILAAGYLYYRINLTRVVDEAGQVREFEVVAGEGVPDIANRLKSEGLIRNAAVYQVYLVEKNIASSLQAGKYELSPAMTIPEIVDILARGETISTEKEITIIEGWTLNEIAGELEKNGFFPKEDFIDAASELDFNFDFLRDKPRSVDLEGYLFPDTYRFFLDATPKQMIYTMLQNFQEKVVSVVGSSGDENYNFHEIITLASMLEGEVRTDEDRALVSDIFRRRIADEYPLQACSTLAYILGKKDIYTIEDTKTDSPYNTYRIKGLPPGPINNPGLSAIRAALNPAPNDYYFFLSRPDTGETVFSKTSAQHEAAKAKYLN